MHIAADDWLFERLIACGVDPTCVDVEWIDDYQSDVLRFGEGAGEFSDSCLNCLAELYLSFPSIFEFAPTGVGKRFEAAVQRRPRIAQAMAEMKAAQLARLQERGLGDFPPYVAERESLADFAVRAERATGFEPGSMLRVTHNCVHVGWRSGPQPALGAFQILISLVRVAAPDVRLGIMGHESSETGPPAG